MMSCEHAIHAADSRLLPYWQKFMYEVAMVKQLGILTWFMTLS